MTAIQCAECGATFERKSRARQAFCCPEHQVRFHKTMERRGAVILPLLLTKSMGRHGKLGAGLPAYCRKEADALLARWNVADREAGRNPSLISKHKFDTLWRSVDL